MEELKVYFIIIWWLIALAIAIVDYKTKLIPLWALLLFAIVSLFCVYVRDHLSFLDIVFSFSLPFLIFALGAASNSIRVGGADWIFFPIFLIFFQFPIASIILTISILILTLLTNLKKIKNNVYPFITILVIIGFIAQSLIFITEIV